MLTLFAHLALLLVLSNQQIRVGAEGIIVETPIDSPAAWCIELLGGLTVHQLRWIYTSLPESQLDHSGWDVNSVPFSDGDDSTH